MITINLLYRITVLILIKIDNALYTKFFIYHSGSQANTTRVNEQFTRTILMNNCQPSTKSLVSCQLYLLHILLSTTLMALNE